MRSVFLLTLFLATLNASTLEAKRKISIDSLLMKHPYVHAIDAQNLDSLIAARKSRLFYVIIYTNYCAGTKYALNEAIALRQKYSEDDISILLCSCVPADNIEEMIGVTEAVRKLIPNVYWIDSRKYRDRSDHRKKGMLFRNEICEPCKPDIIGVPYRILFRKDGSIAGKGYEGFKEAIQRELQ